MIISIQFIIILTIILTFSSFLVIMVVSPKKDKKRDTKEEGVKCEHCGHFHYDKQSFCSKCGWKL